MSPGGPAHEALQKLGAVAGVGQLIIRGNLADIGDIGLQILVIALVQRQAPEPLSRRLPRR